MSERLKQMLREDIECYDTSMMTTPHLSRIRHAEAALLALLEEKNVPSVLSDGAWKEPTVQREIITFIETPESMTRRARSFEEEGKDR